jgi:hypothetical protein
LIGTGLNVLGYLKFGFRGVEIGFKCGFFLFELRVEEKIKHQEPREE